MANDDTLPQKRPPERPKVLDIGAGDREAPANAIPNIIADLVETETWRNAATVLMGVLLIGLGYWAYQRRARVDRARRGSTSLEALLGTVVDRRRRLGRRPSRRDGAPRARAATSSQPATRLAQAARAPAPAPATRALDRCRGPGAAGPRQHGDVAGGDRVQDRRPQRRRHRVRDARALRPAAALDRVPPEARPRARRQAAVRAPLSGSRADGRGQGRAVAAAAVVPRADPRPGRADGGGARDGRVRGPEFATLFSPQRDRAGRRLRLRRRRPAAHADRATARCSPRRASSRTSSTAQRAFTIHVRDPGGNLSAGHRSRLEPAARPLTEPAALALAARAKGGGIRAQRAINEPVSRLHRRRQSIGAWRWLPAYDIGVIAEIPAAEAFAAAALPAASAFSVIGGFIVLTLVAALYVGGVAVAAAAASSGACSGSARTRWSGRSAKAGWRRSTSRATRC